MRRGYKPPTHSSTEFELDLAPLLAVMVKLVPVLLISSAFVQLMIVETELPQVVKEAIERQNLDNNPKVEVVVEASKSQGFNIEYTENGQSKNVNIPTKNGQFDLAQLQENLKAFKQKHPDVFRMELNPDENVGYDEIVKIMDEVRQTNDKSQFKFIDPKTKKEVSTNYMFPEVVFGNMMEGS